MNPLPAASGEAEAKPETVLGSCKQGELEGDQGPPHAALLSIMELKTDAYTLFLVGKVKGRNPETSVLFDDNHGPSCLLLVYLI